MVFVTKEMFLSIISDVNRKMLSLIRERDGLFGNHDGRKRIIKAVYFSSSNNLNDSILGLCTNKNKIELYQYVCAYMSIEAGLINKYNKDFNPDQQKFILFLEEWLRNESKGKIHTEDYLEIIKYELKKKKYYRITWQNTLILFAFILIASIAFAFALNGRYIKVNDETVFDKWGKSYVYHGN